MAVAWTISKNGEAFQTLRSLGIRTCVLDLQSLAVSELRLTLPVENVYDEPPFTFGDNVRLFRNGVGHFVGTVSLVTSSGEPGSELYQVSVSDAWWNFERIIYQQFLVTKQGTPPTTLSAIRSSRVVLGKDAWGNPVTSDAVINDIVLQAGIGSSPFIASLIQGFFVEARDISLAEAIRRMLALTPDCVGWFDYTSGSPTFNVRRRGFLGSVSIDLDEDPKRLASFSVVPRNDLLMRGVVLNYITTQEDDAGNSWLQYTVDSAGAVTGDAVIFAHVELSGQGTDRPEEVPVGLAANFFTCFNVLQWEGTLAFHEQDCSNPAPLGNVLNLTNGRAAWATMNAVVSGVAEDIMNGTTEISLGSPPGLGLADYVDMMRMFRNRPPGSDFPAKQDNGDAGVPDSEGGPGPNPDNPGGPSNPGAGKPSGGNGAGSGSVGGYPTTQITHCVDGVERTDTVVLGQ